MQKIREIFGSSPGHADRDELVQGSGGGGPVEVVWWVKDMGTQWRIKGEAFVVGRDIDGGEGAGSGVRTVKSEVGRRMRRTEREGKEGEWSWGRELTAHFGNCSPGMRGMVSPFLLRERSMGWMCAYLRYRILEESTTRHTEEWTRAR